MFKKILYYTAILSIASLEAINCNASQLKDLLDNKTNTVVFNDGTVSCNEDTLDMQKSHVSINNTTLINTNELPTNNNRIQVSASIAGSTNISLQNFGNANNLPKSIIFHGNNSQFNGALYLYPEIDTISFSTQDSIIKNLNIPSNSDQNRKITMNVPNDFYASCVDVPKNLSITFYKIADNNNLDQTSLETIVPNPEALQKLKEEHPEYSEILNSYKITSKPYLKYIQIQSNESNDFNEMIGVVNEFGISFKLDNQNNFVQLMFNTDINSETLLKAMIILAEKFNKLAVTETIINVLTQSYISSFSDSLKKLGYTVLLNESRDAITITKNNNVYKINLTGNTTFNIVKRVLTDLANNFIVSTIEDAEKEKEDLDEEIINSNISNNFNDNVKKLNVKTYSYTVTNITDILTALQELKTAIENEKKEELDNEIKNLLSTDDKKLITSTNTIKQNLKIFEQKTKDKQKIETANIIFEKMKLPYDIKINNQYEIPKKLSLLNNKINEDINEQVNEQVNDNYNNIKKSVIQKSVNYLSNSLGKSPSDEIKVNIKSNKVRINGKTQRQFTGKNENNIDTQYNILSQDDSNQIIMTDREPDQISVLNNEHDLIINTRSVDSVIDSSLQAQENMSQNSIQRFFGSFFSIWTGTSGSRFVVRLRNALRASIILGGFLFAYNFSGRIMNPRMMYNSQNGNLGIRFRQADNQIVNHLVLDTDDYTDGEAGEFNVNDPESGWSPKPAFDWMKDKINNAQSGRLDDRQDDDQDIE